MRRLPDERGHFGRFGGRFIPETLMSPVEELEKAYLEVRHDKEFQQELRKLMNTFAGRPTPLFFAERLSGRLGVQIYLKREDLCHTGAHKINNALGQALLARKMGKTRIIAETGEGRKLVLAPIVAGNLSIQKIPMQEAETLRGEHETLAPDVQRAEN